MKVTLQAFLPFMIFTQYQTFHLSWKIFFLYFRINIFTYLIWNRKWQTTQALLPGELKDRGAWRATVHGTTKSQTQLSMHVPT